MNDTSSSDVFPQTWRFTKTGEETCDTGTCPKCGIIYERLRHFDYCPNCEDNYNPEIRKLFISGTNNAN
jgi:uncharacterized OB-fold protein